MSLPLSKFPTFSMAILVSTYTIAQFKPHSKGTNESELKNELNREFTQDGKLSVVVSDLTYVRVNKKMIK